MVAVFTGFRLVMFKMVSGAAWLAMESRMFEPMEPEMEVLACGSRF